MQSCSYHLDFSMVEFMMELYFLSLFGFRSLCCQGWRLISYLKVRNYAMNKQWVLIQFNEASVYVG